MSFNRLAVAVSAVLVALSGLAIAAPQSSNTEGASAAGAAAPVRMKHSRLDTNNDGVVSREEAAANPRLAERFEQLDGNKDGRLAADELRAARSEGARQRGDGPGREGMRGEGRRHGGGRGGEGHWRSLDTNGDGRISQAEAAARAEFAARFAELDVNKDGHVDQADREARRKQRRDEWFATADSNRDGQLSRAEFDAAHARKEAERQAERDSVPPAPRR